MKLLSLINNLVNQIQQLTIDRILMKMDHPILTRDNSMQSSQEYEGLTLSETQGQKSYLRSSIYSQRPDLNKSASFCNNYKLYSSAATCISSAISQEINFDEKHSCMSHRKRFNYSCLTCTENVCSQCLLDPNQHRNHRFQRYNQRREDLRQEIKKLSAQINFKKGEFNKFINLSQKALQEKPDQQNEKLSKLQIHSKRVSDLMDEAVHKTQNQISSYKTVISQFHQFYDHNLAQLKNKDKVSLIEKVGDRIQQALNYKIKQLEQAKIKIQKPDTASMRPNFYSSIFTMCNFTKIKETTKQKIFEPFEAFQSLWRLKVYPSGYSGAKTDEKHAGIQYMSVYAERLDGSLESSNYIIQIETTSRVDPRLKIRKQFKSQFTKNQSWGYDRYTRLSNIYHHGFLGEDDTLFIKISITPINYYQATRGLAKVSEQKQRIYQENQRRIKILTVMLKKKKQLQASSHFQTIHQVKQEPQQACQQVLGGLTANKNQNNENIVEEKNSEEKKEPSMFSQYLLKAKEQSRVKVQERSNISRNRTHYPSISLQKKSPSKLIRLVSLKNSQLIQSSKRKIHNRSSTYY